MPIYGYACKNCGHTMDALQKVNDTPLVDCPECEQPELKRQLSAPRFRLKGKGWYETDFKSDNQRNIAGDKQPEKTDAKADDKTKDSKPADSKPEKTMKEKAPKNKQSTA